MIYAIVLVYLIYLVYKYDICGLRNGKEMNYICTFGGGGRRNLNDIFAFSEFKVFDNSFGFACCNGNGLYCFERS